MTCNFSDKDPYWIYVRKGCYIYLDWKTYVLIWWVYSDKLSSQWSIKLNISEPKHCRVCPLTSFILVARGMLSAMHKTVSCQSPLFMMKHFGALAPNVLDIFVLIFVLRIPLSTLMFFLISGPIFIVDLCFTHIK